MATIENNRALVIGVGGDLPNTVDDAAGIAKYLKDPSRCGFSPDNVTLLTERDASREGVLAALKKLAQDAAEDSTVVVYFSGHGTLVETDDGSVNYLMTNGYDLKKRPATCIKGSEFASMLSAIEAQRLLLLLDCCHAGGVSTADAGSAPPLKKAAIPVEVQEVMARGSGRWVIASCQDDETSLVGKPYSLFTRAVLQALEGQGNSKKDGLVRVLDILQHTREKVPQWAAKVIIDRTGQQQHPIGTIENVAADFPVAYYAASSAKKGDFSTVKEALPDPDFEQVAQLNGAQMQISYSATLTGDGAIAQGSNSVAVGRGGVHIGGSNKGNINTGTQISGDIVRGNKSLGSKIRKNINTGGGAYIGGDVAAQGDFVGRDKIVNTSGAQRAETDKLSDGARAVSKLLGEYFTLVEIANFAVELEINSKELSGDTRDEFARQLVKLADENEQLGELKKLMRGARPNLRSQLT